MIFEKKYSSSRGNLYRVVADNGKWLMLECGVTEKLLLKAFHHDLKGVEGCLLTHAHKDHSKSFLKVIQKGIYVYASQGTWEALSGGKNKWKHWHRAKVAKDLEMIETDSFKVLPFDVPHDAPEPLGFVIFEKATHEYLLFVTDASCIPSAFPYEFSIIGICCSFDSETLKRREKEGTIDPSLARRLLDAHMERKMTQAYLRDKCHLKQCREIHLLHCSKDNLDIQAAKKAIEGVTLCKVII
jgi:phosphoribosyl 1,2-cyclic phosphodiesterase